MRFNDLLPTVLSAEPLGGAGAVTLWRQCVDLLAQNDRPGKPPLGPQDKSALLAKMEELRGRVSEHQRIASVVELGHRLQSPSLVRFFASDRPSICAAAMSRAHLPDSTWTTLLPQLGPTARGVLRNRRDLGPDTTRALQSFGSVDLVLSDAGGREDMLGHGSAVAPELAPGPAEPVSQIKRLVDRIEQFTSAHRSRTGMPSPAPVSEALHSNPPREFQFETDADGLLIWVGEGPRAALIGLSIAEPALFGGTGADGHVVGAFRQRSGFENARFTFESGPMAGEWRMSAIPFFDPHSGRFQGYRGSARRPYIHEVPAVPLAANSPDEQQQTAFGVGINGDSIRQLVHELRTPLNAILGFAEIIEQQIFGPAASQYREMASNIIADARQLLGAFDDLDLATRMERGDDGAQPAPVDPAALIASVAGHFHMPNGNGHRIDIAVPGALPMVAFDPLQAERMVQHLLRTLVSVAAPHETVTGVCWFQPDGDTGQVLLAMDRPTALQCMSEKDLLDPGYGPDGDWPDAPLLGVGFSLRLVRSLAQGGQGIMSVTSDRIILSLPAVKQPVEGEQSLC